MEWWEMMGQSPQMPQADPSGSPAAMGAMMQPDPTAQIQMYNRPANDPQEYEKRLGGWSELVQRFQSNPNLQRAMMMTGAMMAQPLQPGQTAGGALGNAAVVGMNAYTAGTAADRQAMMEAAKNAREERRLGMEEAKVGPEIASIEAGTEGRKATTAATQVKIGIEERSADDIVATTKANRQKAQTAADEGVKDAALKELQRDNDALKAMAQRGNISTMVQQEIDKNDATIQQLRASATEKGAKGRQEVAKAGMDEMTAEIVRSLPADEQRDFALKRGKYGAGRDSALVQQRDLYGELYDSLPEDDPNKRGMDKAQFVLQRLKEGKQSSALKELTDYVAKMEGAGLTPDPEIVDLYTKAAKAAGAGRSAGTPGEQPPTQKVTGTIAQPGKGKKAAPTGKTQSDPVDYPGDAAYAALPSGTWYKAPDGTTRKKK